MPNYRVTQDATVTATVDGVSDTYHVTEGLLLDGPLGEVLVGLNLAEVTDDPIPVEGARKTRKRPAKKAAASRRRTRPVLIDPAPETPTAPEPADQDPADPPALDDTEA